MARLLIDTNVLLDYAMGREPGCSGFIQLVECAEAGGHTLHAASVSLKDCYYVICSSLKAVNRKADGMVSEADALAAAEIAWAQIDTLMGLLEVVSVGYDECMQAKAYRPLHNDFEDNLVLAAALTSKADVLVTGDEVLQRHAPLACLSPQNAVSMLGAG